MSNPESIETRLLHDAVESENLKIIESLLRNGTNPNIVDAKGMTAVHLVCNRTRLTRKHCEIVTLLIKYKADLNIKDKSGNSPMMTLFRPNHGYYTLRLKMLHLLIKNGADVPQNYKNRSQKSLHVLENQNCIRQLENLLQRGKGLSILTFPNEYPLHLGVQFKSLEIVELLLKIGINPNELDDKHMTPLNRICNFLRLTEVDLKMIRLLIHYKADVNMTEEKEKENGGEKYVHDPKTESPIMNLFYNKNDYELRKEALQLLLDNKADITHHNREGETVLDLILQNEVNTNITDIVELLIKYGIDVNKVNKNGMTPLYYPLHQEEPNKVEILLKNGANPDVCCFTSLTPLNFICVENKLTCSHVDMIRLLIQYKADVNIEDEDGNSPAMNLYDGFQYHLHKKVDRLNDESDDYHFRKEIFIILKENNAIVASLDWKGE